MSNAAPAELDFLKCLADAWDGRGNNVFTGGESRALWSLTYQDPYDSKPAWVELTGEQRRRLVLAARGAISLGRVCQVLLQ